MNETKQKNSAALRLKRVFFFAALAALCVIGLLWFCRPEKSELEKRELTAFPAFSWEDFWDGSYFSGIDTWYSDTYPLREMLIAGNRAVRSLYGLQGSQLIDKGETAEEIPDPGETPAGPAELPEEPVEPEEEPLPDGTVTGAGEMVGSIYVNNGCGYGLYYFVQNAVEQYAAVINRAYEQVGGMANVYCLIAPINSGVMLDESIIKSLGCSDQQQAIEYLYSRIAPGVHTVSVTEELRRHNAEYIFFHTDHHWTQRGAYYAYRQFAAARGFVPHELEQFQTVSFPGFLGTFYSGSGSAALGNNPDTIEAYYPLATNTMHMLMTDGVTYEWSIINDVSTYGAGSKYSCYTGADNPYSYIENPNLSDGSACLVIKDSYANAFIPFLVDHYQYVYWIDFRYYQGTVADLVQEKGIQDVIFLQNIYNTSSANAVANLQKLVRQ